MVDKVNKFQMPGKEPFKQVNTPLLKCFGKNCMIGVRKGVINDVPCSFLIKMLFIDHDSEQFNNTQGWMGVIELNSSLVREIFPVELAFILFTVSLVSTNNIL